MASRRTPSSSQSHRQCRSHADVVRRRSGGQPATTRSRLAERAMKGGASIVCTQELFRSQYFCQVEDHRFFGLAETIPGPVHRRALAAGAQKHGAVVVASLFEKRAAGPVPQHRRRHRRRRLDHGHLSQDAHPRRSALLREVLLHAGRHRLPRVADHARHHRRADLLGPVVPRGARASPRCRAPRSCSTRPPSAGIRREKKEYGDGAARVVGADSAQPRRGQRLLRLRAEPHRPRARARRRTASR